MIYNGRALAIFALGVILGAHSTLFSMERDAVALANERERMLFHQVCAEHGIGLIKWQKARRLVDIKAHEAEAKRQLNSDNPVPYGYRAFICECLRKKGLDPEKIDIISITKDFCNIGSTDAAIFVDSTEVGAMTPNALKACVFHEISHMLHKDYAVGLIFDVFFPDKKPAIYYEWRRAQEVRADLEAARDLSPDALHEYCLYNLMSWREVLVMCFDQYFTGEMTAEELTRFWDESLRTHPDNYVRYRYLKGLLPAGTEKSAGSCALDEKYVPMPLRRFMPPADDSVANAIFKQEYARAMLEYSFLQSKRLMQGVIDKQF